MATDNVVGTVSPRCSCTFDTLSMYTCMGVYDCKKTDSKVNTTQKVMPGKLAVMPNFGTLQHDIQIISGCFTRLSSSVVMHGHNCYMYTKFYFWEGRWGGGEMHIFQ